MSKKRFKIWLFDKCGLKRNPGMSILGALFIPILGVMCHKMYKLHPFGYYIPHYRMVNPSLSILF